MKTATTDMSAHIAQEVTTLAGCLKITRKDGEVFAYTTHDQDLVISNGDSPETFTTYQANGSYVPSASQTDNQMGVPNEEITGAIMATDITYEQLVAGKFNGATVQKFFVNWADLSQGKIILPGYKLGTITPEDNHFRTELRGMIDTLRARTGEVAEPVCRVDLFSPECGLNADDFVQHGTVVSTDGHKTMVVSGITDSFFPLFTEDLLVPPAATPWEFTGGINSAFDFGNHSGTAPIATGDAINSRMEGWSLLPVGMGEDFRFRASARRRQWAERRHLGRHDGFEWKLLPDPLRDYRKIHTGQGRIDSRLYRWQRERDRGSRRW
jgi:hypothetical protein